jgi:hypothetical protein
MRLALWLGDYGTVLYMIDGVLRNSPSKARHHSLPLLAEYCRRMSIARPDYVVAPSSGSTGFISVGLVFGILERLPEIRGILASGLGFVKGAP